MVAALLNTLGGLPWHRYVSWGLAAMIMYLAYLVFIPFFVPMFWGAVLGTIFHPVYDRLNRRLRGHSTLSSLLLTCAVLLLVLVPVLGLAAELVSQATDLVQHAQAYFGSGAWFSPDSLIGLYVWPYIRGLGLDRAQVHQYALFVLRNVAGYVVAFGPTLIGNLVGLVLNIVFTLVALYYTFKDGHRLLARIKALVPLPRQEVEELVARLHDVVWASVFSTFAVAAMQGAAGGIVWWLVGLPDALFWGTVMGALSLVPILGPFAVWIPASIYLLLVGQYFQGIVLAAAGSTVVNVIDNIMRPLLIHGRVPINNFYLLFAILGGVYLLGFTGLLFGPILISLTLTIIRLYQEHHAAAPPAPPEASPATP